MPRLTALLALLLVLAGCNQIDPYTREGNWRPNDANAANLRAMIAVPADLATARSDGPGDGIPGGSQRDTMGGTLGEAALDRLRHDRVYPLPDSGIAQIVPISSGAATQPVAAPAAGGSN